MCIADTIYFWQIIHFLQRDFSLLSSREIG
jgi:hypothetical protein